VIIPFIGRNEITLNTDYLKELDETQMLDLLNTVHHENQHLQDGFYGTLGGILAGRGDARHEQIFNNANAFTDKHAESFLNFIMIGRVCGGN